MSPHFDAAACPHRILRAAGTNRLGFCFATAGPGAFNLISGLGVAMTDSYPVLAVSGYARMKWEGWGALNETSGLHRTADSRTMFAATTKKSFLISDPSDTCDVCTGPGRPPKATLTASSRTEPGRRSGG